MATVAAIILAAGKGSRIGGPKWQLACGDKTFLDTIVDSLAQAGVQKIACVVDSHSMPVPDPRTTLVINPAPEKGMFSSVYCGVLTFTDVEGYLIMPVDHPLVQVVTIQELLAAFADNPEKIVRPVHNNKAGHPVIIPRTAVSNIMDAELDGNFKQFLQDQNPEIHDVVVADSGVLNNINDLKALYGCKNIHRDCGGCTGQ